VSAGRHEEDRRGQARVAVRLRPNRARRWSGGAWHEIGAEIVDLSSRGLGLRVDVPLRLGDRVSLSIPLDDGEPELRVTVEVRHIRADANADAWRAGGLFKALAAAEHERVVGFVMRELHARHRL
jgi:hypothetical protein